MFGFNWLWIDPLQDRRGFPSSPFAPPLPSIPSPAPTHPFIQDASNERVPSSLPPPAFLYARGRILADVPCGRALLLRSQHQDKHRQQLNTLITQIIEIWLQYCYLSICALQCWMQPLRSFLFDWCEPSSPCCCHPFALLSSWDEGAIPKHRSIYRSRHFS